MAPSACKVTERSLASMFGCWSCSGPTGLAPVAETEVVVVVAEKRPTAIAADISNDKPLDTKVPELRERSRSKDSTNLSDTASLLTWEEESISDSSEASQAAPAEVVEEANATPRSESAPASAAEAPFKLVADAEAVPSSEPLLSRHMPFMTLERMREALLDGSEDAVMVAFSRQAIKAQDVSPTGWFEHPHTPGAKVQQVRCKVPAPPDVPEMALKMLGLSKLIENTTVNCLTWTDDEIVLTQDSQLVGAMYSDRFYMRNIQSFKVDPRGGLLWRSWPRVVWTKPLPFTHKFIGVIIESKVRQEVASSAGVLVKILQQLPAEQPREPVRDLPCTEPVIARASTRLQL